MLVTIRQISPIHSEQRSFHRAQLILFGEQEARKYGAETPIYHKGIVAVEETGDLREPGGVILYWE